MKKHTKKKYIALNLIAVIMLICLTGCSMPFSGKGADLESEYVRPGNGEAYIYYHEDMSIKRRDNVYQIRQPDVLSASVEELLGELMKEYEGIFSFYTYMFDESNIRLEVSFTAASPLSREEVLLSTASVCTTLFQLDGISAIKINISDDDNKILLSEDYDRSSFFFGGYDSAEGYNEKSVKVYMPYNGDAKLKAYMLRVNPDYHLSEQELIINYLAEQECIPSGTSVISVSVSEGECVLDLSPEFETGIPGRTAGEVLYSVVNSITSLDGIDRIRILVDGQSREDFNGIEQIRDSMVFNADIVAE